MGWHPGGQFPDTDTKEAQCPDTITLPHFHLKTFFITASQFATIDI